MFWVWEIAKVCDNRIHRRCLSRGEKGVGKREAKAELDVEAELETIIIELINDLS